MVLTTEQIALIRDEYIRDRDRFAYAPESVKWRNDFLISILTEIIVLREIQQKSSSLKIKIEGKVD